MTFSSDVSAWAAKVNGRLEAVQRDAAQSLVETVLLPGPSKKSAGQGGNMPVDTGWLRSSLVASLNAMPQINPSSNPPTGSPENSFQPEFSEVFSTIAQWKLGDTLYLGFTAAYARIQEAKRQFVGLSAQRWPQISDASVSKLQASLSRPS